MIKKDYQRRHLRAPFRESVLYADGSFVLRASSVTISEGGLLLDEIPSFPATDEVPMIISIPQLPSLRNFSLFKMQTFSKEFFSRHVIRVSARMVRREELSRTLNNLFLSRYGIEFININSHDQRYIADYVETFCSNIVYLQTMIDSYNSDDEIKVKVRTLANILGYDSSLKISQLRAIVSHDYKSLQWL